MFVGVVGGFRGLYCFLDGLFFLIVGVAFCVYVLDFEGRFICYLFCYVLGVGIFVFEDVVVTVVGFVVVSDFVYGVVYVF